MEENKMAKKKSKLDLAKENLESTIKKTNETIESLGELTNSLYSELNSIQNLFDKIRNVSNDKRKQYEQLKEVRLNWKQQAEEIETDYKNSMAIAANEGAAAVGIGVRVATLGPSAAMGIATTFGVASTGTAISTLSGAAATNAALAWLGGGALAAGGGGTTAGATLLGLAGPIGWAIAGVALVTSGLVIWKSSRDKKCIESIYTLISERDTKSYNLAIVELNERIALIIDEVEKLRSAIKEINTFGLDYNKMTEAQQYELGSYVNLMLSSTQLLVDPIIGLQPKYSSNDFDKFFALNGKKADNKLCEDFQDLIITLTNFLYKIDLNERDKKLIFKSIKKNKTMLKSFNIKKNELPYAIIDIVEEALNYRYTNAAAQIL